MPRMSEDQMREYYSAMTVAQLKSYVRHIQLSSATRLTRKGELVRAIVRWHTTRPDGGVSHG